MTFPEPTTFNGADLRRWPSANGQPEPRHCLDCDWTGLGSFAHADHWRATGHRIRHGRRPQPLVSICAWCDRTRAQLRALTAEGREVTHAICEAHRREFEAGL